MSEKTVLLTFASPAYYRSGFRLVRSARKFGLTEVEWRSKREFLKTQFSRDHRQIAEQKRGSGYWLWKPYYIRELLRTLPENSILIYCDSGLEVMSSLEPLVQMARSSLSKGVMLFANFQGSGYFNKVPLQPTPYNLYVELNKNRYWMKRDGFVLMGLDEEKYWNSPQVDASFQIYRKCQEAEEFVNEWLYYCQNAGIITDAPNAGGKDNLQPFLWHVHDQSILSLLAEKHGVELYRCPSQFGNHYKLEEYREPGEFLLLPYSDAPMANSRYATLTRHHRNHDLPFFNRLKTTIRNELSIFRSHLFWRFGA